jgi:hypothetical protein
MVSAIAGGMDHQGPGETVALDRFGQQHAGQRYAPRQPQVRAERVLTFLLLDYVQNLQDDGKLNCEKVGSTNWLWSFPSEGKKITYSAFEAAQKDHAKAHDGVMALRQKIAERAAELDQEQGESEGAGESRDELTTHQATLEAELQTMRRELRSYSDDDPTEIEHKGLEAKRLFEEATAYTEDIYTLEDYFKKQGVPTEQMTTIQVGIYGDEFDTEEYALRELLFEE